MPAAPSPVTQVPPQPPSAATIKTIIPMVNALDAAILQAAQVDRKECDGVKVLQTLADPTIEIYDACQPWGIYTFPLTKRVYAWFQYIVKNSDLINDETASMDWKFFDDAVFAVADAKMGEEDGEEVAEEDAEGYDETDSEEEPGDAMVVEDVAGGPAGSAGVASNSRGTGGTKRKSSNPVPADMDPPITTKRTRTGSRTDSTVDNTKGTTALRDEPSEPNLKLYVVPCSKCVSTNTVCYMQSGGKKAKACDRCRALKRPCSYGDSKWVETLPSTALARIKDDWGVVDKGNQATKGKKVGGTKGKKVADDETRSGDGETEEKGDTNTKSGGKAASRVTRSRSKDVPQPPSTSSRSVHALRGETVVRGSPVPPAVASTSALAIPAPPSRQPSPNRVSTGGTSGGNGENGPAAMLFECTTRLDGQIVDVQGQMWALSREVEGLDSVCEDLEQLRRDQDDIRGEMEDQEASIRQRFETTATLIQTLDQQSRLEELQRRTERELGNLVVAREGLERTQQVMQERIDGIVARVGGIEESVANVRRDGVEANGERITRIERSITGIEEGLRRNQASPSLLQAIEEAFRRHEERIEPRLTSIEQHLYMLDQRFNALAVSLTQYPATSNFLVPRSGDLAIAPKTVFPPTLSSANHFVAEMPRDAVSSSHRSIASGSQAPWSDVERRFTNLGGISSGSGHTARSVVPSFGGGQDSPWYGTGPGRTSDTSGEIVPPIGFTGGKSGRRFDGHKVASRPTSREGSPSTRPTPDHNVHHTL